MLKKDSRLDGYFEKRTTYQLQVHHYQHISDKHLWVEELEIGIDSMDLHCNCKPSAIQIIQSTELVTNKFEVLGTHKSSRNDE